MKKIRCDKCNSTLVYLRIKSNEMICRKCGYIKKLKEDNNKDE